MKQIKHEETVYINPLIDFGFKRIFGNIPILRDVEFLAKYSKMNTDDRNRYWSSYDQYVTTLGAIDYAREEGRNEGAQNISEIAEIPVEEVERIINNA